MLSKFHNFILNKLIQNFSKFSENEKARRWEEIRIRQHRLMTEVEHATPAHLDHIMKSGFTMNDIKGLHRNYEDGEGGDEMMRPSRPPRKGSLSRNGDMLTVDGGDIVRSSSELDMARYGEGMDDKKKRGRSPFRFFGKKRDQSKDKATKSPDRANQGRNVVQSNLMVRAPTVRVSNVSL